MLETQALAGRHWARQRPYKRRSILILTNRITTSHRITTSALHRDAEMREWLCRLERRLQTIEQRRASLERRRGGVAALKAKDLTRLADATALRAPQEAKGIKNQKLFASINDGSMTEDDLSELANKLEGYTIMGQNDVKSTARVGIILGKNERNGDQYLRTVTVRREKTGWKVADISGQGVIESGMPKARAGARR